MHGQNPNIEPLVDSDCLVRHWTFFGGIRCADGRDILNSTIGAGLTPTERDVSYPGRGVLVHFPVVGLGLGLRKLRSGLIVKFYRRKT
jgi:hypothetical protein